MKFTSLIIFLFITHQLSAQKDSFDLVIYSPPLNWVKETSETIISYTTTGNNNKSWCRINIVKSTISKGSIEQDFQNEWKDLIVKNYAPHGKLQWKQLTAQGGWRVATGNSSFQFDNKDAIAILTTATGFERCISIVVVTNTQEYMGDVEQMLSSIVFKQPQIRSDATENTTIQSAVDGAKNILGTWGIGKTVASSQNMHMNEGSIVTQYTFKNNGTYSFYIKTFRYQSDRLLLTRENGTYKIDGNKLILFPNKSIVQAWSRKDGTDQWGRLLSTSNNMLEKTTYIYNLENFGSGWVLILKAPTITKRDGAFNNSNNDAWFYPAKSAIEIIKLPSQ